MKKKEEATKSINELIIDEAVKQFKEGKIKNSIDVEDYLDSLLQPLMQKLLDTELENHLEYARYTHLKGKKSQNIRNGYCKTKRVKTKYGNIKIKTPRDRNGSFKPIIIEKGQTKLSGFEDKCIALYAKGMSLRDLEKTLKEIYGVKIGKDEIMKLISAVSEETEQWKKRKLKSMYVFTYADCLYIPIKDDITTTKKAVYVIIGVDVNGYKEILGLWIDRTESGSFWSSVFEDLKNIYSICPKKNAKEIINDYKKIYTSTSLEEANIQLEVFKNKYENEQKRIVKKVQDFMQYLEPLFELPQEIRKCIYTSNAVESVNSALRKVTRGKGAFPNESSVYKVLYLRIKELSEKWKKPIQNWKTIQLQLIEIFGNRYTKYLEL